MNEAKESNRFKANHPLRLQLMRLQFPKFVYKAKLQFVMKWK